MGLQDKKYKLIPAGKKTIHRTQDVKRFYQLVALRDIPEHGVKAGDKGGYVTRKDSLSHEGSCWVADEAQIVGKVYISDNAYIGEKATVYYFYSLATSYKPGAIHVKENVKIMGEAFVDSRCYSGSQHPYDKIIEGNAYIFGQVLVRNVHHISGNAQIYGSASVNKVRLITDDAKIYGNATLLHVAVVSGSSEIFGQADIGPQCSITGKSKIFEKAKLEENVEVADSVIAGNTHLLHKQRVSNGKLNETKIASTMESLESFTLGDMADAGETQVYRPSVTKQNASLRAFTEIQASIATYETDIVKIIKYPVMTDRTNPFTQEMIFALNTSRRLIDDPDSIEFKDSIKDLEKAFLAAESNALKIASTALSESEKKKTELAKDLFRVAANEASSEHEKKVAFIQGFKQLEGVIAVPEIAVDTFRLKIGLQEIEA